MSSLPITSVIAALSGILLVALSLRVGLLRAKEDIWFLDGGNDELMRRMRAQGNFIEYVPIALLLIALVEFGGGASGLVWGLGIGLLAARLAHAIGVAKRATSPARSAGALGTFAVLLVAAGWLLVANL
jgi:uncharacterized membrane protein YecN with MAPEG domain